MNDLLSLPALLSGAADACAMLGSLTPASNREREKAAEIARRLRLIEVSLARLVEQVERWRSALPQGMPIRGRRGRGAALADIADEFALDANRCGIALRFQVARHEEGQ